LPAAEKFLIQRLQSLSGVPRQLVIGLAWLAVALYALAPAVPQQYMPMAGMDHAMPPGMHHDMAGMSAGMHHAMADMPDHTGGADSSGRAGKAGHDCPICKVAATSVVLAAPPAL